MIKEVICLLTLLFVLAGCTDHNDSSVKSGVGIIKAKLFKPERVVSEDGITFFPSDPPIFLPTHKERTIPPSFHLVINFCGKDYTIKVSKAIFDEAVEGNEVVLKYTGCKVNIKTVLLINNAEQKSAK